MPFFCGWTQTHTQHIIFFTVKHTTDIHTINKIDHVMDDFDQAAMSDFADQMMYTTGCDASHITQLSNNSASSATANNATKSRHLMDVLTRQRTRPFFGPEPPPPKSAHPPHSRSSNNHVGLFTAQDNKPAPSVHRTDASMEIKKKSSVPNTYCDPVPELVEQFDNCREFGPKSGISRGHRLRRALELDRDVDPEVVAILLQNPSYCNFMYP